jgi:cytochrome c oxidase cbb3-type subunit 1
VLFYLVPQLSGRPLFSQYHAMLTFWLLALFGGGCGIPQSAPVPAWMTALSTICHLFVLLAVVAVAINLVRTWGSGSRGWKPFPLPLLAFSAAAYVTASLLNTLAALPPVAAITDFTFFTPARAQLFLYGFYAMALFAAMYHVLPRVLGFALPSSRLVKVHAGCAVLGISISTLALAIGGLLQGRILNQPEVAFLDSLQPGLTALRLATLGDLLLWVGHGALWLNVAWAMAGWFRVGCLPVLAAAAQPEPAGTAR